MSPITQNQTQWIRKYCDAKKKKKKKPMEKLFMRKKPLQGKPSSMKRIHYSKRRFTITQQSFPKHHNQQLIGKTFR